VIWVKICGIKHEEDAKWAEECGANALGFVFEPMSPRCVGGIDWHPSWIDELKPELVAVYGPAPAELPAAPFRTIQSTDWSRSGSPQGIIKQTVARVGPMESADRVIRRIPGAHRLVLDSLQRDVYGGSGQKIDWDLAAEVVKLSKIPVILAGGLTPENVGEAIMKVKPFGVDVSSGVEAAPGVKDHAKVKKFIDMAREFGAMAARDDWANAGTGY
jgi:phosphoribosylanthranilate isomerase